MKRRRTDWGIRMNLIRSSKLNFLGSVERCRGLGG
jgi:hypothetical protein